ncbi:hypothetical protein EsH8_III_000638 [Colletotrichum jinshuiense]
MSSWYSRILTNTTSQISNLQSRLLQSENDGDTEDDTHVCRVLRGYYTESGRAFPGWLPPDPKAPPPAPVVAQPAQVGSRYGGLQAQQQPGPATGLSSLWDNNGGGQQRQDAMSLRQGRGAPPPMRGSEQSARPSPFARAGDSGREEVQARPLPSQRAGSFQTSAAYGRDTVNTPPGSSAGGSAGGSAQDRLKQRLWGGARTTSPASGAGGQGPFQPPGRGGGGGDYEERFAPGGMYDGGNAGGGGGGGRPFMAANSPWASNEAEFSGGGGGGGGRGPGLPSGPRRQGLPSGPRMR